MTITIPVVDPGAAYRAYRTELDVALSAVMGSGWYILGRDVRAFEEEFAEYTGIPHMLGVANGTDAIELALRTIGIGPGDIVATVSHTAVATVAAVELTGAIPLLIDIDPASYTLDPQKLADTLEDLEREGRRVRAVIAVHLYGHPCDLVALTDICERHGAVLIEDCAQAHGATNDGRHVGVTGGAACFSFYPTKNLGAFGDGGAVGFTSSELADRCRALREYGWRERYISQLRGMNSRLDELQAALLSVRLRHLDEEVARRRAVAAIYDHELSEIVNIPAVRAGAEHAYHLYVVRSPDRQALAVGLAERGVGSGVHYPAAVHQQPAYSGRVWIGSGGMAVTETAAREVLSLPMHGLLTDADAMRVAEAVRDHCRTA